MAVVHVFIFRRDLRVVDNHAWAHMTSSKVKKGEYVLPVFLFDQKQINATRNKYYSEAAARFMVESLLDLAGVLGGGLHAFVHDGDDAGALDAISRSLKTKGMTISGVYFNRDYTPFARERDDRIAAWCDKHSIYCFAPWTDYALIDIPNMPKGYKVFGAFLKKYKHKDVGRRRESNAKIVPPGVKILKGLRNKSYVAMNAWGQLVYGNGQSDGKGRYILGGRTEGLKRLNKVTSGAFLKDYATERNFPSKDGTSLMSAYLKFGCISVREFYWAVMQAYGKNHGIINEMYWRAFYDQMVYWWPHTLRHQTSRDENDGWNGNGTYNASSKWLSRDSVAFRRITKGECGVPFVDAAIRCLYATGFMHNRLRMVLCMLAVRICKVDWRVMEQWFAKFIVDYHPASNRGGWEWAVLYRFVLNPWVQTERFDPECAFIKQWIPELANVPAKSILNWHDPLTRDALIASGTCKYKNIPIVDRKCKNAMV